MIKFKESIENLYPGYFALVMATGIVSIASYLLGMVSIALPLFSINKVVYVVLWILTLFRIFWHYPKFIADLEDHAKGSGFFTLVAGTCILGNQFVLISKDLTTGVSLFFIGTILWLILLYSFFTAVIVRRAKPTLETGVHGGWFMAVVATQAVSILGALVAPGLPAWKDYVFFSALVLFLLGAMLYTLIISLVFYRLTFFSLTPEAFIPLYWVDMGAAAITTLAGARLVLAQAQWTFVPEILPFLKGFTLFFWATATWWIPLLLILSIWRYKYLYRFQISFGYDPQYWSLVFPIGMYTTCSFVFAQATGLSPLYFVSRYFIYAALVAWVVTFVGMIYRVVRGLLE